MNRTRVRGIRLVYLQELLQKKAKEDPVIKSLPAKKYGRLFLLERKGTTSKCKEEDLKLTVTIENIPPELILNWNQTSQHCSFIKMDNGSKCVQVNGIDDKQQITVLFVDRSLGISSHYKLYIKVKPLGATPITSPQAGI